MVAAILLFLSIGLGMVEYKSRMAKYLDDTWPKWRQEVAIWESTTDYNLKIWPQWEEAKWFIGLRKRTD